MIRHVWSLVCARMITDMETRNISLINVYEQFNITGSPNPEGVLHIPIDLVTTWERENLDLEQPEQGAQRVIFVSPSGKEYPMIEMGIDLKQHERARVQVHIPNLPLREAGRHYFRIDYRLNESDEWRPAARVSILMNFIPEEAKTAG